MANISGWWTLSVTTGCDLSDNDREHIGKMVTQGFTEGEIVKEEMEGGE